MPKLYDGHGRPVELTPCGRCWQPMESFECPLCAGEGEIDGQTCDSCDGSGTAYLCPKCELGECDDD